jgi:hypothetical protein
LAAASASGLVFFLRASTHFIEKVIELLPGAREAGGNLGGFPRRDVTLGLALTPGDFVARQPGAETSFEGVREVADDPRGGEDRSDSGVVGAATARAAVRRDDDPRVVPD